MGAGDEEERKAVASPCPLARSRVLMFTWLSSLTHPSHPPPRVLPSGPPAWAALKAWWGRTECPSNSAKEINRNISAGHFLRHPFAPSWPGEGRQLAPSEPKTPAGPPACVPPMSSNALLPSRTQACTPAAQPRSRFLLCSRVFRGGMVCRCSPALGTARWACIWEADPARTGPRAALPCAQLSL